MAAAAAKTLTVALGSVAFHATQFEWNDMSKLVETTNADCSGKEAFVVGIEGVSGNARGYCKSGSTPTKPTQSCSATCFDGANTHTASVVIEELKITAQIDGAAEIALTFKGTAQ